MTLFAASELPAARTGDVRAIGEWNNNAEMIADVARLGYLDGYVLDATYGEGAFWNDYRPAHFLSNDLHKPADCQCDFKRLPFNAGAFDAVVFDPPYKLQGTPALGKFDAAYGLENRVRETPDDFDKWYGTAKSVPWQERMEDIRLGALECFRVARRFLLVKCQDQVCSGKVRWQTHMVTEALGVENLRDRFDFVSNGRPQPPGRRQLTARRNHSTLLVFKKGPA